MNIDTELQDYEAAGSLAEELPYWGWLDDERTCLTRAGELMSMARVSPSVLDGQTPQQLDRVIERWQRMLSGLDARTRFYFYLLRRPIRFPEVSPTGASKVVTLGQRKRREFLTKRVQGRVGLCCMGLRSGPIHRGIREDRGAVVDGLREELDGPAAERAEVRLPPFLHRSGGSGAFGKRSTQAGRWWMTSPLYACSKHTRPA